jgi:hypothetical protein
MLCAAKTGNRDIVLVRMLKLSSSHANYLLSQAESGMGYQSVEATTFDFDDEERTRFGRRRFARSQKQQEALILRSDPFASQPAREKTKEGEVLKRFVAYANDVRLRADGSWRPGTFATTEEDAKNVKTGTEAVARYALPNPAPASYVFTGKPKKDTVIQRGTAAPAYGQPGGGAEVYFKDGTQPKTVTGPDKIPNA